LFEKHDSTAEKRGHVECAEPQHQAGIHG
jgi:hypothetical protein